MERGTSGLPEGTASCRKRLIRESDQTGESELVLL